MALFDSLVGEIASRYGVGAQAGPLVREVVQLVTGGTGGLSGFLGRLRTSGLGSEASSWIGNADAVAVSPQTVESALGGSVVNGIAGRLGLAGGAVGAALGYALPKVVALLTPGGVVPQNLSPEIGSFLGSGERVVTRTVEQVRPLSMTVIPETHRHWFRWGIPIAALLGLGALLWLFSSPPPVQTAVLPPIPVASAPAPVAAAVAPAVQPWLWVSNDNGVAAYSGQVRDEATRSSIIDALRGAFGSDKTNGTITVDPDVAPAPWLANLGSGLDNLKVNGVQALFSGDSISVGGLPAAADRDKLVADLRSVFGGGLVFGALADKVANLVSYTTRTSEDALAGLKSGYRADDVVSALNLSIVNFPSGSAEVPTANSALLNQAAAKIRELPA
jgi:OmpA-OmpF porin, OOP family